MFRLEAIGDVPSAVTVAVRHVFSPKHSQPRSKAKVQDTFDEMKSKAEEEASRQRSGLIV